MTMTVTGTNEKYVTHFQDGVRHGLFAVWYANGKRKALRLKRAGRDNRISTLEALRAARAMRCSVLGRRYPESGQWAGRGRGRHVGYPTM